MNGFGSSIATVIGLFVTVAIVAVIVGKNAQTANVIKSAGSSLAAIIGAAVKPVS